jgi:hypothetical protein
VEPAPARGLAELVSPYLKTDVYDMRGVGLPSPVALATLLRDADVRIVSGRTDIPAFLEGVFTPSARRIASTA